MQSTTISFVRHGEVYNPNDIVYGRLPRFRLSENGRNQAAATAKMLQRQDIAAIYSSPMLRARQTARIIGEHLRLPIHRSIRLLETYSPYDGQPAAPLAARDWDVYTGSPPEYDQPSDLITRMTRFITTARHKHAGRHIIAVSHADPIAFTWLWADNKPITVWERNQLQQDSAFPGHASILSLSFNGDGERPYQIDYQHSPLKPVTSSQNA